MLPIQDLVSFVAVADSGSLRAAAGRIHRTQSAVSQALRRLEDAVGFALLDRSEYRIRLTAEGRQFLERAKTLLRGAEGLTQFAKILASGTEERVRIAVHGALPPRLWGPTVARIVEEFPDTTIEIATGEVDNPVMALTSGEAMLALIVRPPSVLQLNATEYRRLGSVAFVRVVRSDLLERLETLPQIVVSDFSDSTSSFGIATGQRRCRVSNHAAKVEMILQGAGWGGVPYELVEPALLTNTLALVRTGSEIGPSRHDYYLYRLVDQARGPVLTALWNAFTQEAAQPVGP
jgi:DNA-binding transcriptional LysR family regulator